MKKRNAAQNYAHGTYAAIARRLGVSPSYVSMVARGQRRNIRIEIALAEALREHQRHQEHLKRITKE